MTFKKLVELSKVEADLNGRQKQYDLQFENYISYLINLIKNTQNPKDGEAVSQVTRVHALSILANLSLREALRP